MTVEFRTADGIVKGKTEVRCRSVGVGVVEDVTLTDDMDAVQVQLRMDPEAGGTAARGIAVLGGAPEGVGRIRDRPGHHHQRRLH